MIKTSYMALPGLKPGSVFFRPSGVMNIIETVGTYLNVSFDMMRSANRKRELVEARQIAMYFIRIHTSESLVNIGKLFGGRDHTTAIHSINNVKDLIFSDELFKAKILKIENKLLQQ